MVFRICRERSNKVDIMRLHVRLENRGIQAGCLEWCLRFDLYQCCKHRRGSHSALASTKKHHFPIILIRKSMISIWTLSIWPSSVDVDDVNNLLSDGIVTFYMAKLTICSGMHSLSALEEIASFLLCFILPSSLVLCMPFGVLTFLLHAMLWFQKIISNILTMIFFKNN